MKPSITASSKVIGTLPPSTIASSNRRRSNPWSQCCLRFLAEPHDLKLADLIAARLARHNAVAVDLPLHRRTRITVGAHEPVDGLLARPPHRVETGVDNQPAGAEAHRLQVAELAERIVGVDAKLIRKLLRIKGPTLAVGVECQHRPDQRHAICVVALPDMARDAVVIAERRKGEFRPFRRIAQVDVILARHLAVDRPRRGIASRRTGFDRGGYALDDQAARHHRGERSRQARPNVRDPTVQICQQLFAAGGRVRIKLGRILAERGHALTNGAAGQALLLHDAFHPRLDRLDLIEAELVNFLRWASGGRAGSQRPLIVSIAILEVPDAGVGGCNRAVLRQLVDLALERGNDLGRHRLRQSIGQFVVG